jgi:hypothetical protein
MFDRVFPRINALGTIPKAKLEALRFERPAPFPKYAWPVTILRFDVPRTFRVVDPYTMAELTKRVVTFRVSMLAVPKT